MLEVSEFRQYAKEAIEASRAAKTQEERCAFLDLAQVWMDAARRVEELLSLH